MLCVVEPCHGKALQQETDTPQEAYALHFPSPSVIRCLTHSGIPEKYRKAVIHKKIKMPGKPPFEQKISLGIKINDQGKKSFIFTGSTFEKDHIIPLMIDTKQVLGLTDVVLLNPFEGKEVLEELLGKQKKTHTVNKVNDYNIDYHTFLKETEGIIGDADFKLELAGTDRSIRGNVRYFLNGVGNIDRFKLFVEGRESKKDDYEIKEEVGAIEILTSIKVYD